MKKRLVHVNPMQAIDPLPEKDYIEDWDGVYLTQAESKRLLAWLKENDLWLFPKVLTPLNTGLRHGEMCALRVEDVIFSPVGAHLKVSRSRCRHMGKIGPTKGRLSRMLPLSERMSEFLRELTDGRSPDERLLWRDWEEGRWPTKVQKHFRKALESAGVRKVTLHQLRHSYAVHFLESGGKLYALQKLLGHRNIKLTERYSHFSKAMAEETRGLVDHFVPEIQADDGVIPSVMSHKRPTNKKTETFPLPWK